MAAMVRATSQHSDIESESDGASAHFFSDHEHPHSDTDVELEAPLPQTGEKLARLTHEALKTEFVGVRHRCSEGDEGASGAAVVHQFRGIKYARVPMRFRNSTMHETFARRTDATKNG